MSPLSRHPPNVGRRLPLGLAALGVVAGLTGAGCPVRAAAERPAVVPQPSGPTVRRTYDEEYARRDPRVDGWDSEAVSAALSRRLGELGEALRSAPPVEAARAAASLLQDLSEPDLRTTPLRPAKLPVTFDSPDFAVRYPPEGLLEQTPWLGKRGPDALAQVLSGMLAPFTAAPAEIHFKIFRVLPTDAGVTTLSRVSLTGATDGGLLQQNALWEAHWRHEAGDRPDAYRLERLRITSFEEVLRRGERPLFADCTESVLGETDAWRRQLLPGLPAWWQTLDRTLGITFRGYQGLALGDVNGDGLDDLFVAQPGGLPDRLFLHRPDGTAEDVSAAAGIDFLELTKSALLVDLDNDGDEDLAEVRAAHVVVFANDGAGRFAPRAILPLPGGVSLAAADYDGDGDLDLYGVAYRNPDEGLPPTPYHDASNGEANTLFRNDGSLAFVDATAAAGLGENNHRFSFAAAWEDYDNDGDPDLYVVNDFGRNNLYRNDGGRFTDVAAAAGVEDISAGMGVSWADFDGDGWMDLYVSNMFSSAGGRVAYQRRFQAGAPEATRRLYQRHARGNSLFRNNGDGTFRDVSVAAGVTMGRWAWGAVFTDFDNDGRPDILVPNGYLTNDLEDDL